MSSMSFDEQDSIYLSQSGVKGMKWGRRKAEARVARLQSDPNRTSYVTRAISKVEYNGLSSKPVTLGTQFKRVGLKGESQLGSQAYVTKSAEDHQRYIAQLYPSGKRGSFYKKSSMNVKTAEVAASPGLKERIDTYISVLDKPMKSLDGRSIVKGRDIVVESNPSLSALSNRDLGLKTYQAFAQSQYLKTSIHSSYFKEIQKKGYNALIDDADRGYIGDLPIILFTDKAGASVTGSKNLSKQDIFNSMGNFKVAEIPKVM